jgi:hypothetical protein
MKSVLRLFITLCLAITLGGIAMGQETTGNIRGTRRFLTPPSPLRTPSEPGQPRLMIRASISFNNCLPLTTS